ncbi:MAG: hypothetical protein HRT68_12150 [Flavobacteriaceae bacterium]|nr:hypothetical protein [Flavobacteriaceae bacterium]
MKKKYITAALLLMMLFITSVSFGQWSRKKGNGYYKLSAWYLEADQHYTDQGIIEPNATRGQLNINFYGEYGLSEKWNIIAYVPFFSRTYQNDILSGTTGELITPGEDLNSIGDVNLGIRYGILQNSNVALSATLKFGIPTGNDSGGSNGSFQTGDGEFNQLIQADLGVPFTLGQTSFYTKIYLGFNNRTQDFSDELRSGLEIGGNFFKKKVWLIGRLDTLQSLQNGSLSAQTAQGSIFANNLEFTSIGGEVAYYITDKLGVSFNYTSAVSGRIIYAAPSFSGGVFLDIK